MTRRFLLSLPFVGALAAKCGVKPQIPQYFNLALHFNLRVIEVQHRALLSDAREQVAAERGRI